MIKRIAVNASALMLLAGSLACGASEPARSDRSGDMPASGLQATAAGDVGGAAQPVAASASAAGTAPAAVVAAPTQAAARMTPLAAPQVAARTGSRRAAEIDPCTLVTPEEAKAALGGREIKAPRRETQLGDPVCFYDEVRSGGTVATSIDLSSSGRDVRKQHEETRRLLGFEPVRGVGDAAYITHLQQLVAVTGEIEFTIQLATTRDGTPEEIKAMLIEMGKRAVTRLK